MASSFLLCLALNVYHEARGEPLAGQMAVANVTWNRAERDPERLCEVVYKPNQFSWVKDKPTVKDSKAYQTALAVSVLSWLFYSVDFSRGATYYHTHSVNPNWNQHMKTTRVIGSHKFMRSKNHATQTPPNQRR